MDMIILEILKIFGHFFLGVILVYVLKKCRIRQWTTLLMVFSLLLLKEIADYQIIGFWEYDDLLLNLAGLIYAVVS